MQIKHFGSGDWRIRHQLDWQTIGYTYYASFAEASSRADDYRCRYDNVRLEYWNGEAWI